MSHARTISYGITIAGILLAIAGYAFDLTEAVALTGLLLIVAGIVKIVMIAIWKSFFAIPIDLPAQTEKSISTRRKV